MKKVPKVAASTFDVKAWNDELLVLNPWARDLALSEQDATFIVARQTATLKRFEDRNVLTEWSEGMLALKDDVESAGLSSEMPLWIILSKADFTGHRFDHNVNFSSALFVGPAVFKGAVFTDIAFFESSVFSGEAVFQKATFCRRVSFQYAQFSGYAHFESATFCVDPDFTGVSFAGQASYNGANFSCSTGNALFNNATFAEIAYFREATFFLNAIFKDATFSGEADFSGATFTRDAIFIKAQFHGVARFVRPLRPRGDGTRVKFIGPADFSNASFIGAADFEDAIFCALAKFDVLNSTATFSLANAQFKVVPSLFGATFRALRLDNVQTPRNGLLGWTKDEEAPARFRELRRRAIEGKDPERELEFFAQEIRTWRFHSKWLMPRVWDRRLYFGLAYGALSDFGRSILRPVLYWLALLLLCAALYLGANEDMRKARAALNPSGTIETLVAYAKTTRAALTNPPQCMDRGLIGTTNPVVEAILLSLQNALIFESSRPEANRRTLACLYGPGDVAQEKYSMMSPRVSFISTLQSLASGVLIFLLLLAVRNLLRLR